MFEAMRLDPPARFENADFPQMWVLAATRPRLSHMPVTKRSISVSESSGKARLMFRRACLETPGKGPMRRASAPPKAEAQSSGNNSNTPNKGAAPQASRRSANRGRAVTLGQVAPIAVGRQNDGRERASPDHSSCWVSGLTDISHQRIRFCQIDNASKPRRDGNPALSIRK
jgi:hypothetical protein